VPILEQQVAAVSNTATIQCLIALMLPTLFIPHGGGPLPLLGDPGHTGLVKFLKAVPSQIQPKPKAILLVSAHWEVCDPPASLPNAACIMLLEFVV
jgi:aromatic ring-opening dioxygenase catalytic subunit (LigB family)